MAWPSTAAPRRRVRLTRKNGPKSGLSRTGQAVGRWVHQVATTIRTPSTTLLATSLATSLAISLTTSLALAGCRSSAPAANPAALPKGGELVASIRTDPPSYNRYVANHAATEVVTLLTQAPLVRVNRANDELEPWLASSWTTTPDGLTYTLTLREGVSFSDGQPLTADDVLFSFRVAYDPKLSSPLASSVTVNGRPLDVSKVDARTLTIRFPEPFAPGLRVLDTLPILPRHKLEPALTAGEFAQAWSPSKPLADLAGLGPFVLAEHVSGQRLVFERNPHYFRTDPGGVRLPYLDRLRLTIVPDQNTEALRLEAGEIDLMTNGDIRPQDHAAFRRLADQGRLTLTEVSVGLDPDFLSFNLRPARLAARRAPWIARREFRQAISCGVDRQAIVDIVYLGAAAPIYGPITPGNRRWHAPITPACAGDRAKARTLLQAAGLTDRNGDGMLEDAANTPARFSVITQAGHLRERVSSVLQDQLRQLGVSVDIVSLDPGGIFKRWQSGDYDAIYFGLQASSTDPALNPDFWLSTGPYHFWNPAQKAPATPWEQRIDELMRQQAAAARLEERQRAFAEVQRIMGDELPSIYFVATRITLATSPRVRNATPAPQIPQLLWSADTLAAAPR
jgi:peptide/nickel transport system substrate-binding protein